MNRNLRTILVGLVALCLFASYPLQAALARPMHEFPRVGKYEVLCGDFHMHTQYSDGRLKPRERVVEAWQHGYDAVAITDHGSCKSYAEALPLAQSLGIVLIRGMESGMAIGEHYVLIGFSDKYEPQNSHKWADKPGAETAFYQDQMREVKANAGLIIWAHPHTGFRDPTKWGIAQGVIQGVEVKNGVVGQGWNTTLTHGSWCYPNGFDWGLENNLAVFANSDEHGARGAEQGPITLLLVEKRTAKGVMDAVRARRTVAWFDGMLWGRKELLTDLVGGMVKARRTEDGSGATQLRLENLGPVPLKARLQAKCAPTDPISIGPYESVLIECPDLPQNLNVQWDNIWINPRENLLTRLGE